MVIKVLSVAELLANLPHGFNQTTWVKMLAEADFKKQDLEVNIGDIHYQIPAASIREHFSPTWFPEPPPPTPIDMPVVVIAPSPAVTQHYPAVKEMVNKFKRATAQKKRAVVKKPIITKKKGKK